MTLRLHSSEFVSDLSFWKNYKEDGVKSEIIAIETHVVVERPR